MRAKHRSGVRTDKGHEGGNRGTKRVTLRPSFVKHSWNSGSSSPSPTPPIAKEGVVGGEGAVIGHPTPNRAKHMAQFGQPRERKEEREKRRERKRERKKREKLRKEERECQREG